MATEKIRKLNLKYSDPENTIFFLFTAAELESGRRRLDGI